MAFIGFDSFNFSAVDIEDYVIGEFGPHIFHFNDTDNPKLVGSSIWYADQSLASYKLDLWLKRYELFFLLLITFIIFIFELSISLRYN